MTLLLKPPRVAPSYILLVWLGLGMATVLMPLTMFIGARVTNRFDGEWDSGDQAAANNYNEAAANNAWWKWGGNNNNNYNNQWSNGGNQQEEQAQEEEPEEEEQQQDEQDQQAQQYQNNNAGGNNNNAYNGSMNYYQKQASPWWKFWGNNNQVAYGQQQQQQGGRADEQDAGVPWWYWGGHQGADGREEELRAPPVLIAAYLWSLLVFFSILFFGFRTFRVKGNLIGLEVALLMFACYCVLSMFLFSSIDGAVETYGRVVEEHGFLGQLGVMVYLTSLLWILFCVGFAIFIRRQAAAKAANQMLQDDILRL